MILFFQIFQFPSQSTGTQYSSIRIFQFGNKQFSLAFVYIQDIIIDCFLNRLHNIITRLSQTTEQTIASGLENAIASAKASPKILPVNSKISCASLSPCTAASYTSFEVMFSAGILRSKLHQYEQPGIHELYELHR